MKKGNDEKTMWTGIRIFFALVLATVLFMGLAVKSSYVYSVWHPFNFLDFLGIVGLVFMMLVLSGGIKTVQEWIEPKSEGSAGLAWVIAVIGAVLLVFSWTC